MKEELQEAKEKDLQELTQYGLSDKEMNKILKKHEKDLEALEAQQAEDRATQEANFKVKYEYNISQDESAFRMYSKIVHCAVTLDMSFAQCWNREYRTVNKTTLLNSACIVPSHTNVNKQLAVK